MLDSVKTFLVGKKTYILGVSSILGVVVAWMNGTVSDFSAIQSIMGALMAMTIRHGVSTTGGN